MIAIFRRGLSHGAVLFALVGIIAHFAAGSAWMILHPHRAAPFVIIAIPYALFWAKPEPQLRGLVWSRYFAFFSGFFLMGASSYLVAILLLDPSQFGKGLVGASDFIYPSLHWTVQCFGSVVVYQVWSAISAAACSVYVMAARKGRSI